MGGKSKQTLRHIVSSTALASAAIMLVAFPGWRKGMKRSMLSALAMVCAVASAHTQNLSPDDLARRFSKPADWRFQVTTPNASTNYVYFNFNLKDGPVVLEVPAAVGAGLLGSVIDAWDVTTAGVGPEDENKGQAAKYLLLPPGFSGDVPAGFIAVRFPTYNGYSLLRAIPAGSTDADVAAALALVKQLRIYPRAQAANQPEQRFIDIHGKTFDGVPAFDEGFFVSLNRMVQEEPVQEHDHRCDGHASEHRHREG
jgi:hypothetical protein